jgi:erythromycin esterase-like protein
MPLPPAREGSWEDVLHQAAADDTLLLLGSAEAARELLQRRGHRAVGVVYHPESERGNYVPAVLPRRYDALVYLDRTGALHPLHEVRAREEGEVPATFPTGV